MPGYVPLFRVLTSSTFAALAVERRTFHDRVFQDVARLRTGLGAGEGLSSAGSDGVLAVWRRTDGSLSTPLPSRGRCGRSAPSGAARRNGGRGLQRGGRRRADQLLDEMVKARATHRYFRGPAAGTPTKGSDRTRPEGRATARGRSPVPEVPAGEMH
jgi:hypothetical protein